MAPDGMLLKDDDGLPPDEVLVLKRYRRARALGHAEMELQIRDGLPVYVRTTQKESLDNPGSIRKLKE